MPDEDDCVKCGRIAESCECVQADGYPRHLSRPVHWCGRQWAVTAFGLEGLGKHGYYNIAKGAIGYAPSSHSWVHHMEEKNWVDLDDFKAALEEAKKLWPAK